MDTIGDFHEPNQGNVGSHFEGRNVNRLPVFLLAALILLFAAVPVRAQASLDVCNKGTISVEVVAATKHWDAIRGFGKYYWEIKGTPVAPGECKNVYGDPNAGEAYLAFGLYDAHGHWGSGTISKVPNFGIYSFLSQSPVLKSASKGVCARLDETYYAVDDDPQTDCAGIRLTGGRHPEVGHGPFFPLTAALYFEPVSERCYTTDAPQKFCNGGLYYLNILPSATDRELHAAEGSAGGAEVPAPASSLPVTHSSSLEHFVDACNAFYGGPASSKYGMTNASSWCACLGSQYRGVMTPEEESKYANDFFRLFHNGIAQPWGYGVSKTDPAWSRLHPAVDQCRQ
jgi:hypothetical protein